MSPFLTFVDWPALLVRGPDAAAWLHGIVTCDVHAARPDRAVWGSLLTKQGKVFADLLVVGSTERIEIALPAGNGAQVLTELGRYLVMEDAEIEPNEVKFVVVYGSRLSEEIRESGVSIALLPWGPPDLYVAWGSEAEIAVLRAKHGGDTLDEAAFGRWLTLCGIPQFGLDYGSEDNLHAASLERRTVDWSKGCYLGQEVVCMQDMRGKVKRRLVQLRGDGGSIIPGGEITTEDGKSVGRVTSSAGKVAMASVTAPYFESQSRLFAGGLPVNVEQLLPR